MTRILITGAGGFVGHYLLQALLQHQSDDIYLASYRDHQSLRQLLPADHILVGDLTDFDYTQNLIKTVQPQLIYHLASLAVVHTNHQLAQQALTNNFALQFNLFEAVRQFSPKARLITISSGNVYGKVQANELPISEITPSRPLNAYAVSKLSQETLALQYYWAYNLDVVILRPFNHTGAGQTENFVIPAFAKQFALIQAGKQDPVIHVGNLDTARDFTDVADMVQAYILAGQQAKTGEIYNLGSGKSHTIKQILDLMLDITQLKVEIKPDSTRLRHVDVPILIADASKFHAITKWEPKIDFKTTLQTVLNYWKEQV